MTQEAQKVAGLTNPFYRLCNGDLLFPEDSSVELPTNCGEALGSAFPDCHYLGGCWGGHLTDGEE